MKATLTCTLCPAAIVTGKVAPGKVNWPLLLAAEEMVTLVPTALSTAVCIPVSPSITLPKLSWAGVIVSDPLVVLEPVPVSGIAIAGPEMNIRPPITPEVFGVKLTLNVRLCPAPNFAGSDGPVTVNPSPAACNADTVSVHECGLLTLTETVAWLPTVT